MPPPGLPNEHDPHRNLNNINIVSSLLYDRELRSHPSHATQGPESASPVQYYTNFQIRREPLPSEIRNIDSASSSDADIDIHMNEPPRPVSGPNASSTRPAVPSGRTIADMQSSERFLLASGRQFFDNRHSLETQGIVQRLENALDVSGTREPQGGIALRRQNAIRRKRTSKDLRLPAQTKARSGLNDESSALIKEILKAFEDYKHFIALLDLQKLSYPIFECYLNHKFGFHDNQLHANLESKLDNFLKKSKQGDMYQVSTKKRSKASTKSNKRQKLFKNYQKRADEETSVTMKSDHLRKSIMNIMYSSSLREGSTFNLANGTMRNISFMVTKVDYQTREINGLFNTVPSLKDPRRTVLDTLVGFKNFLIGKNDILIKNLNLNKKIVLLNTFVNFLSSSDKVYIEEQLRKNTFKFEVSGEMINFSDNDLRFLKKFEISNNKNHDVSSMSIRNLHLIRTKNSRIRLQLMKWLSIEPFKQFEDIFLAKNLNNFRSSLRGLNIKSSKEKILKNFIRLHGFVTNFHALTKNNDFLKANSNGASNSIMKKYKSLKRTFKNLREELNHIVDCNSQFNYMYHSSKYLKDWEFKLINNFAEILSCDENCLLNVQLNFILFEFKVNLHSFVDSTFNYLFDNLGVKGVDMFKDSFNSINNEFKHNKEDDDYLLFICSLNRKSGEMNLENTKLVTNNSANPFNASFHLTEGFNSSPTPTYNIFSFLADEDDDDADYVSANNDRDYEAVDDTNDNTNDTHDEDNEISSDSSPFDSALSDGFDSDNDMGDVVLGAPSRSDQNPYSIGGGNQVYSVV